MISDKTMACCKRLFRCFSVILSVFLFPGIPPAVAQNPVVKVGVYENAPKIFTSESGRPEGIFIDIIEHIAEQEGWKLQYVRGTWGQGLDRLAKGALDLMPDVAYSADREALYAFHRVPVLSSWFQVYARKDSGIRTLLNLNGKRIAVLERSVQQEAFRRMIGNFGLEAALVSVPDYGAIFQMVAEKKADAAVTNRFYGVMHAKKFGLEDTAIIFHPSNLFFAALKNAPRDLLERIDFHLSNLKEDPASVYYDSLKRWTSEEVRFQLPPWVKAAGLIAGMAVLASVAGAFVLKHQIDLRTRELREINREMERRIEERTAELAAAMEKAKAADRIKSAFLATMSHELRTPLNSIIGFTGILLQELAGPLNDEQRKQMTMVQNSARHLLALINDVLDISKIEAGQLELSFAPFHVKSSIDRIMELVSPMAEKKGVALAYDIADDVSAVTTDQRRFEQILLNLLSNAVKFTEKGHIGISCRMEDGDCLVVVSDTGIGIPPEETASIFQPFHQVDTGLSRRHEGTGLGLSICRKLLDLMGGTIAVESQKGKGSTFTVRIPNKAEGLS